VGVSPVCGGDARLALLFFRGLGQGWLPSGLSQQTGDQLVSELPESLVDLRFQLGKGRRVAGQLCGPVLLVICELLLDPFEGAGGFGDGGPGLGIGAEAHGKSFRVETLLLR
jgi:hypothetical protein